MTVNLSGASRGEGKCLTSNSAEVKLFKNKLGWAMARSTHQFFARKRNQQLAYTVYFCKDTVPFEELLKLT